MSTESNVYSQGGGGTHYEFEVQTAYFINFIIGGNIPGLSESHIKEFRQQSGSLGYKTDDLLLKCSDANSIEQRVLFQIKHNLIISEKSQLFKEVLNDAWMDFKNTSLFDSAKDKIYLIKSDLTQAEKNHLKQLLNWAKLKSSFTDFENEVSKIEAKKKYFELFKSIIFQTDNNVSDIELFTFLKCFDILEYDFGHQASIAKASFFTLIELSKSTETATAKQIWDSVFTFISDSDSKGGFFTKDNLPQEVSKYFNNTYFNTTITKLKKLSHQNFEIIELIDDTIGGVNISRRLVFEEAIEKQNKGQFIVLAGEPGAGKSAVAKALLTKSLNKENGYILIFKADELIDKNLRDIFLPFDIKLTLKEIFSHFPLQERNIVYVDSAEKLLEGEGIGFKQLMKSAEELPNVKFIISCRSVNLNLIERKFFYYKPYEKLDVPVLSEEELDLLEEKLPGIKKIRSNNRITSLIKTPKYLDFAVKALKNNAEDFSELNEVEFVNSLWETIVENKINANYDGLPLRRNNLFIEMSVKRAKKMQPFIVLSNPDLSALSCLEKDNVIVKSLNADAYAPAHDVLEDWALVKFVSAQYANKENDEDFFNKLGTEPAMRRAYRLWVQSVLKEQDSNKIDFFTRNLTSTGLDRFWQDESLIAVLNSAYSEIFFDKNFNLLKENNWSVFFRIVHVMRTACRENAGTAKDWKFLVPTGYGWVQVIKLIHQNLNNIPEQYHNLIVNIIGDWQNKLLLSNELPEGTREAGLIILYLLQNTYIKKSDYPYDDKSVERCLCMVFDLCGGIVPEVEEILKKAIKERRKEETDKDWILKRYHDKILTLALSGLKGGNLAKYFPDLIIEIAKQKWYFKPKKPSKNKDSLLSFLGEEHHSTDVNYHFGLVNEFKLEYFPASAYQTPMLWLLRNHPFKAVDFIIELINYCTEKYLSSDFSKDDGCADVEIVLYDNTKIVQHGSSVLWSMYRGTGKVTPYLLQSVLMALEYYLLEVAEWGEAFKDYLQKLIHKLYIKSTSVATTSVISSICQAYPLMVDEKLLPLFTHRKLISWDVSRFTGDFHPINLMSSNEIFDKERLKSNKLPHRLKHNPGLKGFIVEYTFNIRVLNQKVFEIIDRHRELAGKKDIDWKKMLDDMDIRTWKITNQITDGDKTSFQIEPSYSEDVQEHMDELKAPFEESNRNAGFKLLLLNVEKKDKKITIEQWREIFIYYKQLKGFIFHEHTPGLLAAVGIRDIWNELTMEEKEWSVITVLEIANKLIEKQHKPYSFSLDISPFDDDAIMDVIPLLITLPELQINIKQIELLIIDLLTTHFQLNDPAYSKFLASLNSNLWGIAPDKASKYFRGLIGFAKFTKENPFYIDHRYKEEQINSYLKKLNSFINKIYKGKVNVEYDKINIPEYSKWILQKTIAIIPNRNPPEECLDFLKRMIDVYIAKEVEGRKSGDYESRIHEIRVLLTEKISSIIFWNINSLGGGLMEYFLNKIHDITTLSIALKGSNEIFLFFRGTIRNIIIIADHNLPTEEPEKSQLTISNFQNTWQKFEEVLSVQKIPLFADLLLLEIEWNDTAASWRPIENMKDFFERNIKKYGASNPQAVVNILSHVGDKTLMPQGINLLADIFKTTTKLILSYKHSEKLMHRIYENHLTEVKNNKELFTNYLWMLDEMTTQGSSDAYWIREFLISFR
jgi:ABC-type oligopeptide transport system ATPase subunit